MQFNIQPFAKVIGDDDSMPFVCTPSGVTQFHSTSMVDALDCLKELGPSARQTEIDTILADRKIDPEAGRIFLERINILRRYRDDLRVAVHSPGSGIAPLVAAQIRTNDAIDVYTIDDPSDIAGPVILISIQAEYNKKTARSIVEACNANQDIFLLHAYFVLRNFVVDGFYSSRMALPDHFSSLYNLAGLDRSSKFKPSSWADIFFSQVGTIHSSTIPTLKRSAIEEMAALHLLYTRFRQLISSETTPVFSDDLGTITEMNLDSGAVLRHRANHSHYSASVREPAVDNARSSSES